MDQTGHSMDFADLLYHIWSYYSVSWCQCKLGSRRIDICIWADWTLRGPADESHVLQCGAIDFEYRWAHRSFLHNGHCLSLTEAYFFSGAMHFCFSNQSLHALNWVQERWKVFNDLYGFHCHPMSNLSWLINTFKPDTAYKLSWNSMLMEPTGSKCCCITKMQGCLVSRCGFSWVL